jgi:isoaspartyl peptidase/L-asparaginase-like protein (Ntn-hydrolase superfamily)
MQGWTLVLHGGAGPLRAQNYSREEAHLSQLLDEGGALLSRGAPAIDVVEQMAASLEACGYHIAGKGAAPNAKGDYELDAAIMDGAQRRAGAVAALRGFVSPVRVARRVMEATPHALLVGAGAEAFADEQRCERVGDPALYYEPAVMRPVAPGELAHGTVGAVARDAAGRLAAATSTGGLLNKTPGRVGDVPLFGCGTWADGRVAVSCTGQGEMFIRSAVAADVSARMAYGGMSLFAAAAGALADMAALGGDGGLIAVDAAGRFAMPFTSQGMKRGVISSTGVKQVATQRES